MHHLIACPPLHHLEEGGFECFLKDENTLLPRQSPTKFYCEWCYSVFFQQFYCVLRLRERKKKRRSHLNLFFPIREENRRKMHHLNKMTSMPLLMDIVPFFFSSKNIVPFVSSFLLFCLICIWGQLFFLLDLWLTLL